MRLASTPQQSRPWMPSGFPDSSRGDLPGRQQSRRTAVPVTVLATCIFNDVVNVTVEKVVFPWG